VAALLTIFIIAIIDQFLPDDMYEPLSPAALIGGLLIIFAFVVLSWATYKEMDEEKRRRYSIGQASESDVENDDGELFSS
jgi:hypothetical protein